MPEILLKPLTNTSNHVRNLATNKYPMLNNVQIYKDSFNLVKTSINSASYESYYRDGKHAPSVTIYHIRDFINSLKQVMNSSFTNIRKHSSVFNEQMDTSTSTILNIVMDKSDLEINNLIAKKNETTESCGRTIKTSHHIDNQPYVKQRLLFLYLLVQECPSISKQIPFVQTVLSEFSDLFKDIKLPDPTLPPKTI